MHGSLSGNKVSAFRACYEGIGRARSFDGMRPGSSGLPEFETIRAPAAQQEQKWRAIMTVSPIKGRHQDGDEQVVSQEVECKEYVKRWRGLQFFFRIESRETTRIVRKPTQGMKQRAAGLHAAEIANAIPPADPGGDATDSEETTSKDWMAACGLMPPNTSDGPHI